MSRRAASFDFHQHLDTRFDNLPVPFFLLGSQETVSTLILVLEFSKSESQDPGMILIYSAADYRTHNENWPEFVLLKKRLKPL